MWFVGNRSIVDGFHVDLKGKINGDNNQHENKNALLRTIAADTLQSSINPVQWSLSQKGVRSTSSSPTILVTRSGNIRMRATVPASELVSEVLEQAYARQRNGHSKYTQNYINKNAWTHQCII